MTISELQKDYAAYNFWANARMVNWLKTNAADLLETETPSSFPTLWKTLLHIWGAEKVWLQRLDGLGPTEFISQTFQGSADDLFAGILAQSEEFQHVLNSKSDEWFSEKMTFPTFALGPVEGSRFEIVLHCLNHSTYHRGQLVTMGRSLGLTSPPSTDYLGFMLSKRQV